MECWHLGKLAAEPQGSHMGWDPHLRICVQHKEPSLMIQLLPQEHSPISPLRRTGMSQHWGVDCAGMSPVRPQTVTISTVVFFPYAFFLFISVFFVSVSWGDEVSLPSSWSPGANSGISSTEPHPTYYFSSAQQKYDFFFPLFTF